MKVLIIEDQEALRKVLRDKLQIAGFETLVAKDGAEGWELAKISNPDVILLNVILPQKSAFDVVDALKQDPKLKDIPIFVLADLGQEETLEKIAQMGVKDGFIVARTSIDDVVEKVKKTLQP